MFRFMSHKGYITKVVLVVPSERVRLVLVVPSGRARGVRLPRVKREPTYKIYTFNHVNYDYLFCKFDKLTHLNYDDLFCKFYKLTH